MKTRTNQTISLLVVASMVALSTSQINSLSAGDIVLKKDDSGYHAYLVSYKKDGTGICLTYTDASCVETVSYDLVDGEWVYNSTDISHLGEVKASGIDSETAIEGQVLTANGSGGSEWRSPAGDHFYAHILTLSHLVSCTIITRDNTPFTTSTLASYLYEKGYSNRDGKSLPVFYAEKSSSGVKDITIYRTLFASASDTLQLGTQTWRYVSEENPSINNGSANCSVVEDTVFEI